MAKWGEQVKAYPLDGSGPKVGFFLHAGGEGDDGKDSIQVGADAQPLAYREPGPDGYDEDGPNGTYASAPHEPHAKP